MSFAMASLPCAQLAGAVERSDATSTRPSNPAHVSKHACKRRPCLATRQGHGRRGLPPACAASSSQASAAKEQAVTETYMQWAAQAGIVSPKMRQAFFGELRGAQATADIPAEEPIVTVPRAAALVVMPQQRCPVEGLAAGVWKELPWFVKMALLLVEEQRQGRASAVWGYVEQLPSSIDAPVRWSDEELQALQYPPAIQAIRQQRQQWQQYHQQLVAAWGGSANSSTNTGGGSSGSGSGSGGGGSSSGIGCPDWETLLWALENVRSRSFSGPWTGSSIADKARTAAVILGGGGAYALWAHLPLQQALNGVLAALMFNVVYDLLLAKRLKWYAMCPVIDAANHSSQAESEVAFEYFQDSFVLSTKAPQAAGQQVFISYGQQTNDSLLQYYGFVEKANPRDTYVFSATLGGQALALTLGAKGSLTANSLAAARAAQPDRAALQRELLAALEQELESKATSLADDERALKSEHLLTPRAALATAFRAEKKRLLQKGIERARKRLSKSEQGS